MTAKLFALFVVCVWVFLDESLSTEGNVRSRRQVCADGSYEHEGRTCCLCAAGQRVKEHCTPDSPNDGQCELCESGTYNSVANFQETSQPCTSCSHPNANLEEEEPCTSAGDTKCRCKKHHFCSSKECIICHPCKICGIGGTKDDCTASSNTVCSDAGGAIAGIVLVVIVVTGAFVAAGCVTIRRKTQERKRKREQEGKEEGGCQVELDVLVPDDVNLEPLLPDVAKELGWKDMKSVAVHSGIAMAVIESCKRDYPNDTEEQTLQLLRRWVEKEDGDAANKLIRILKNKDKKCKAENISYMLSKVNSAGNS